MNGKIGPIPTVIIFLVVGIALLIDAPMVVLHKKVQNHLNRQDQKIESLMLVQQRVTVTPTATPSATPTPTVVKKSSSIKSVATPAATTVQVK